MYGGIDQLVDTYKGTPQPLAQKVQKAQQGQPPGAIPPDLEEALALQQIAELQNGAKNQQAMQAGGAQPTVVQKLHQMLGAQQAQAQMPQMPQGAPAPQGQPVMAASGGSITQLMSNLGQNYAGGGIVAFDEGGDVPEKKPLRYYPLSEQGADWEARMQAERDAKIKAALEEEARRQALVSQIPTGGQQAPASTGPMPGEAERNITNAMAAMPGASAAKGFSGGVRGLLAALAGMGDRESAAPAAAAKETAVDPEVEKLKRLAAARAETGQSANPALSPKPPVANVPPAAPRPSGVSTTAPEKTAAVDPNSLRALADKYIRDEMGLNPETESDKMVARARKLMGLDEILNEKRSRVSDFEKAVAESKANRTPEWIKALQAAGGAPVRGGLGMLLGQMGAAATKTREGYDSQDLEYKRELNRLRDVISDAQLSGNKELAKEALAAYREVDARRKAALTSATSLLNVDQQTEASNQRAREALAARNQNAAIAAQARTDAKEAQRDASYREQAMKLAMAAAQNAMKLPANMAKYKDTSAEQLAASMYANIYNALKSGKMGAAPSAESPSGTSKPGWGIKPI